MNGNGAGKGQGALAGVKVLDWTMWQFGPVAASMLGDMGADVIKLEALDGDVGRAVSSMESAQAGMPNGRNAYFETCNRSKRGIAVNLKTSEGREIAHRLVAEADVLIENFRNGVAERLAMDYDTLKAINPLLVYGSASGFGPEGPDALMPSLDACGQARAGLMMSATPPWAKHPVSVRGAPSDQIGGIILCLGILSALWARESQGVGQKVDGGVAHEQHDVASGACHRNGPAHRQPHADAEPRGCAELYVQHLQVQGWELAARVQPAAETILASVRGGAGHPAGAG